MNYFIRTSSRLGPLLLALLLPVLALGQTYNEASGFVVMEMENTPSPLGLWQQDDSLANHTGSGYLQFLGNTFVSGPATSPLEYTFKVNQPGLYYLHLHCAKEMHDGRTDVANDAYVRVEGDYTAGPGPYDSHGDNASLALLQSNTKFFGGLVDNWQWAGGPAGSGRLDPGGETNKRVAVYNFKAGEIYKLVVSGRSKFFRINRIVFRHTSVLESTALDLSEPESARVPMGGLIYDAIDDFPSILSGTVPYYADNDNDALAIDASVVANRTGFARASRSFDGAAGTYDVTITTLTEEDGESVYRLRVNGATVRTFTNPSVYDPPTSPLDLQPHTHVWSGISLSPGDTLAIESNADTNEQIAEQGGTAWSRGRWRQIELTASTGLVRPPAGRLAIVADGNSADPDDIGATAVMFGILHGSALQDRLVHVSHSCDLDPTMGGNPISPADELRRQGVLHAVCATGIGTFGPFNNLTNYFNCRSNQTAAVNHLTAAIDASTVNDPLWIIEAGEPDIIGFALQAATAANRQHVHVISHHPANDDSGDTFTWAQILALGVQEHQIGDQNVGLQTTILPWNWAQTHGHPAIQWIWGRLKYAEQDGVVGFQSNKFDCSDAGMVYWWITGANAGGNANATPTEIQELLLRTDIPGPDGPFTIPGKIDAVDYNFGGEGVGYHDTTAGNTGGAYRQDDVDIDTSSEGGFNIGWTNAGEWLDYNINASQAGTHDVTLRISTPKADSSFKLLLNGSDLTPTTIVPTTGDWNVYTDLTLPSLAFPAGPSTLRVEVVNGSGAFNLSTIQVGEIVQSNTVTTLTLINTDTDQDIGPLVDGETLYLSQLPTSNLTVRADTFPSVVGSVRFGWNGNANHQTESVAPYAFAGDTAGNYNPWTLGLGPHTITATPYTATGATGTPETALTISFTIEAGSAGVPEVDAGTGQVIRLPTDTVALTGTATDDGTIVSTLWTQQAGPNTATLGGTNTLNLTASGLVQGSYTFRLTASDNDNNSAFDQVFVHVVPAGSGTAIVTGEHKTWHKLTFSWFGPATSETAATNPFSDYRLNATFSHAESGKSYTVPGYFAADGDAAETSADSGNVWRAHFAPDEIGDWTYVVSFRTGSDIAISTDPEAGTTAGYFNADGGTFQITATDKTGRDLRGKGRLRYVGKHHLQFAETGEYFLKAGVDAPENFLAYDDFDDTPNDQDQQPNLRKSWGAHAGDYHPPSAATFTWQGGKGTEILGAVRYLSNKGLNVFSFLTFNVDGDDDNVFPHRLKSTVAAYEAVADNARWAHANGVHHDRFDISKMDQWERVFEYGGRMGMYLHFKTQETENDQRMDGGALGRERKIYYRELIARYGHHLALNWNLGEENTNSDAQVKDFAQWFYELDPYRHNVVLHTYPGQKDTVYTPKLGTASKLTGLSLQTDQATFSKVFADTLTWVQNSAAAGVPWVVACDEPGDASHALRPVSDEGNSWVDGRKNALWGNVMAGGAGVEFYFGYQHVHSDLTCQDFRSRDLFWDTCHHLLDFFRDNRIPFQNMSNTNALVSGGGNNANRCLSKPGEVYVVQLYNGGTHTLDLSNAPAKPFRVRWFDPRNGGALALGNPVTGGGVVRLGPPPNTTDKDWIVLVTPMTAGSGPIAHWPLDEGSGTVANDASGNGYTGTLLNAPNWSSDGIRTSYVSFDGADDRIATLFRYALSTASDFTWSWWAKQESTGPADNGAIMVGNRYPSPGGGGATYAFIKLTPSMTQLADTNDVGGIDRYDYPNTVQGEWHHYAMTKQGTTYQWYVDGAPQGDEKILLYSEESPIPFLMGGDDDGSGTKTNEHFQGGIDDVALFDRALTPNEIIYLKYGAYAPPHPPTPALVHNLTGRDVVFSWSDARVRLQVCTDLIQGDWVDVPEGESGLMIVHPVADRRYFRLILD